MLNVWKGHSVHKMCLHIGSGLFGRFVSSLRLTLQQRMGWVEDLRNFSLLLSFFLFFFTFYHSAHSLDYLFAHKVNIYRSEFPGLRANWILCDAAGGTQVLNLRVIVGGTQMFFVMEEPRSFINNSKAHQAVFRSSIAVYYIHYTAATSSAIKQYCPSAHIYHSCHKGQPGSLTQCD